MVGSCLGKFTFVHIGLLSRFLKVSFLFDKEDSIIILIIKFILITYRKVLSEEVTVKDSTCNELPSVVSQYPKIELVKT